MNKRIDLTGRTFGELTVLSLSDRTLDDGSKLWKCRCTCEKIVYVASFSLLHDHYKSCGCKRNEKRDAGVKKHIEKDSVDGTRKSALKAKLHAGNKSGHKGVIWMQSRNKWKAYIGLKGKQITLGYFDNKEDAIAARKDAEEKYHKPYLKQDLGKGKQKQELIDITGEKIGRLTAIKEVERSGKNRRYLFRCECEKEIITQMSAVIYGNTRSCGCLKKDTPLLKDMTGMTFDRLKVIRRVPNRSNSNEAMWECLCTCSNKCIVSGKNLRNGNTKSCGCGRGRKSKFNKADVIIGLLSLYNTHGKVKNSVVEKYFDCLITTIRNRFENKKMDDVWQEIKELHIIGNILMENGTLASSE